MSQCAKIEWIVRVLEETCYIVHVMRPSDLCTQEVAVFLGIV